MSRSISRRKLEKKLSRLLDEAGRLGLYSDKSTAAYAGTIIRATKAMGDTELRNTIGVLQGQISKGVPLRIRLR
jgi:hypothetical protein